MNSLLVEKNKRKFDFAVTYTSIVYFNFDKLTMRMYKQEGDDGQGMRDYGSLTIRDTVEIQMGLL